MVYMGSKAKYAQHIVPILQKAIDENNVDTYIENFCLSGDQQVYTETKISTIKDLQIGDCVYDDKGQLAKVINKLQSSNTKGKRITLKGNVILRATDNHTFYLQDGKEILAQDIKVGDVLLTADYKMQNNQISELDLAPYITLTDHYSKGRNGKIVDDRNIKLYHTAPTIPRYIPITTELMRCYGLIIAEGDKSNITMHKDELSFLEEFIDNYNKILGLPLEEQKKYYIRQEKKSVQLAVPYKTIYERLFFQAMNIGYGAHNKNISFLFKVNPAMCLEAIRYMHIGDGCVIKKGKYRSWNYKTCSKLLAHQLQTLLSIKFGIKATLSHGINKIRKFEGRELPETEYYNISVTREEDITFLTGIENENQIRCQKSKGFCVTSIEEINDIFYDITLDNQSHRFILDGGIVTHNCGGANIIDKIKCENRYGYDRSDTLIALLQQAQEDMSGVLLVGTKELWDKGKAYVKDGKMPEDMTLADIGAMEFLASFSNRGYPGGYAKNTSTRNYFEEARRNLAAQAPQLAGIKFACQNYWELEPTSGAVIYLDPPYAGTKHYGYANQPKMDYNHFWNWVRDISKDNYVFISEQQAPNDFEVIWQQNVKRTNGLDNNYKAVEKLFKYKG